MKYTTNSLIILFLVSFTISVSAEYRLGLDYTIVDNPLPVKKDGVVEVTESFWYGCGGCYSFEPAINDWAAKQGPDVKFTKVPVPWGQIHRLHASLYYTIDALKLDQSTHSAVFVTIHKEGNFLQTTKRIQDFLKNFGVAPEITEQYLNSFTIKQKINRDAKHSKQLKIDATPMIVVDGKYIIEVRRGRSYQEMLNVVDHVVELQRPNS
tara:strand:- start:1458 stop:2084 length:627 start_codon:yes stop_codon:yes gene_type:complete